MEYHDGDHLASDLTISPFLRIRNTGTSPVVLSTLTLRYWYSDEGSTPEAYTCDFATALCTNVTGQILPIARPPTDHFLQVGFIARRCR